MHHDIPLITTIVAGLVLAFIFGAIANRFKLPPLVGYLVAGILVGPYTPGFVGDQDIANELAEIGVILLMFGVGLHFSLKDLLSVRAIAIPGAIVQMAVATALGLGLGLVMGWGVFGSIVFGLSLSVASTVVLLKTMQDRRLMETERGKIAVGWLIVEDMAMILALVLIPAFAAVMGTSDIVVSDPFVSFVERVFRTDVGIWGVMGLTVVKVAAFVGFMLIVGRRLIPWALHATAHTGSRELFRLAVLAIALGVALGSSVLFGVSLALGAFFAGMILSESELSHRAAQETLPLRDAFAVLFFVSVGMLFNPYIILTNPLALIATVLIIVIGKSIAAFAIVVLFGRQVSTALTISASLAQIGEFSFILASLGVGLAIMPPEAQDLILAGALISIILNPLVFFVLDKVKPRLEARVARRKPYPTEREEPFDGPLAPSPAAAASDVMHEIAPESIALDTHPAMLEDDEAQPTRLSGHTILVGFGRVGSVVGEGLRAANASLLVIEDSDASIEAARRMGIEVIVGNAASGEVLKLANIVAARTVVIAIPNSFEAGQVTEQSRKLNTGVKIIARAHSDEEESYLANLGADTVIMGEREIGLGMLAFIGGDRERAATEVSKSVRMAAGPSIVAAAVAAGATSPLPATPTASAGETRIEPGFAPAAPTETMREEPETADAPDEDIDIVVGGDGTVMLPDEPIPMPPPAEPAVEDEPEALEPPVEAPSSSEIVPAEIVPIEEPVKAEGVPSESVGFDELAHEPEPEPEPDADLTISEDQAIVPGDPEVGIVQSDDNSTETDPKTSSDLDAEEPEKQDAVPPVLPETKG